ncbi:hypothetical protein JKP88DRAFT_327142 [Tribonema minus]|uniref:Flavin-containing monooxygenase n=1 Tax=Tribonema minus TaxID=303371 RepID=A0A835YZ95_9STRA|nr:hypothetical protein JKP88DRAFT_327142 [Tribonema minus]
MEGGKQGCAEPLDVKTVAVIGAGPSGLVTLKYLLDAGLKATCFEQGSDLGGTFVNKAYDDATLVSSKFLTPFSDLRLPEECAAHQTLPECCAYLQEYAATFNLLQHIEFNTQVTDVSRATSSGRYRVTTAPVTAAGRSSSCVSCNAWNDSAGASTGPCACDTHAGAVASSDNGSNRVSGSSRGGGSESGGSTVHHFDAVAVCSGLHNVPRVLRIAGLESFTGTIMHSSEYKERSIFAGKRVLVVGTGETGLDLAYRAVLSASSVTLLTRSGFLSVPAIFGDKHSGLPLDTLITNLFESAYEHHWIHAARLKWAVTAVLIRVGFLLATGSSKGFNQWAGHVTPVRRGYHIINKSTAAMPYINRPYKRQSVLGCLLYSWWDTPAKAAVASNMHIDLRRGSIARIQGSQYDVIILATGYRQHFPFLHGNMMDGGVDGHGVGEPDPLPPASEGHHIVSAQEPTLAFIGFIRPNVGAIPPMSELQVMWWLERLRGRVVRPKCAPSYHVLARKLPYGVDYGAYMHQVARDIGAAPSLTTLLCKGGPKALIAYALGQAYISFFRISGPFASPHALTAARSELWGPVVQRGFLANAAFTALLIPFGVLNGAAWVLDQVFVQRKAASAVTIAAAAAAAAAFRRLRC